MADDPSTPLAFSRHVIDVNSRDEGAAFARRLASLGDVIAVNLVAADGTSAVFCERHLQLLLAAGPSTIVVDTIPSAVFRRVVMGKITEAERDALALRATLRTVPLGDAGGLALAVQQRIEQVALLLDGFQLQRGSQRLRAEVAALAAGRQSLAGGMSAVDNVLVMDSVQYELVPTLRALMALLT